MPIRLVCGHTSNGSFAVAPGIQPATGPVFFLKPDQTWTDQDTVFASGQAAGNLSVGLPDASGYDLVRRVRGADGVASRIDPALPVMVLTGRGGELDRVRGFDRGADDYLVKPFSYPELRGRVAALLRRTNRRPGMGRLRAGDLEIDPPSRTVILRGKRLDLSQKEFALLRTLATEPTRVFSKEELLRTVWGFRSMGISLLKVP